MNNNAKKIDNAYDNLVNTIDEMDKKYKELKPGETLSDDDFKKLSSVLKEARSVAEDTDIQKEFSTKHEPIPEDLETHVVNERRDNKTGLFAVTGDDPVTFSGDLDTKYSIQPETILDILNEHFGEIEELDKVSELITRKANGEVFDAYKELPQSMKNIVDIEAIKYPDPKSVRKMIAEMLINELADEVKKNAGMDMDDFLRDIKNDILNFSNEISQDTAKIAIDMMNEHVETINAAIEKATKDNNQEQLNRLLDIKRAILDTDNLDNFKEFCKNVKIKKFDIEKPSRWYQDFLRKYKDHKYNIYDISDCEMILSRHFGNDKVSHNRNVSLLIAFCKYTMNFNPDNIYEHTFMYYFIKNIIILDRLKPRGIIVDVDGARSIYDHIHNNIEQCMNLIKIPSN